jgi:Rad3-related DNA helicase
VKKYGERLKIKNQKLLVHLLDILRAFATICAQLSQAVNKDQSYVRLSYIDFFLKLALKEISIHKIRRYFELNSLDKKLAYFNAKDQLPKKGSPYTPGKISTGVINRVLNFISEFTNFDEKAQLLILKWNDGRREVLKIMCLESKELREIIESSRLTVIAGGTLEPLD